MEGREEKISERERGGQKEGRERRRVRREGWREK